MHLQEGKDSEILLNYIRIKIKIFLEYLVKISKYANIWTVAYHLIY